MTLFGWVLTVVLTLMFCTGLDQRLKGTAPKSMDRVLFIIGILIIGILTIGTGKLL